MNSTVIELVIFKAKAGVSQSSLKAAANKTTLVLQKMNGFLSRELSVTETGEQWADIVHWRDMTSAQKAAQAFMNEPDCQEFISLIDKTTMTFLHLNSMLIVNA